MRRAGSEMQSTFQVSFIELELLSALSMLILIKGFEAHAIEFVMRKAMKPVKSAKFYAAVYALINKGYVYKTVGKTGGESIGLTSTGLMVVERFDMRISELIDDNENLIKTDKTLGEILEGKLN